MTRAALRLALVVVTLLTLVGPVRAADGVTVGAPSASGALGQPLTFTTTFTSSAEPQRVELLSHLPSETVNQVQQAEVTGSGGSYTATLTHEPDDGHVVPNTTFLYRFRVVTQGGVTLGPEARFTYRDERFQWRTLEGRVVRLHWYEGDDDFGRRALEIGERGIDQAARLLGVTETEPVDFFIYGDQTEFQEALGPGTRENVAGEAHGYIRTMFGLLRPFELGSTEVDELIEHELSHLVFGTAVENPYRQAPRWLDEGLAVYLSEDAPRASWKAILAAAIQRREVIPLSGLGALFPTVGEKFTLAYAESVSAIEFFVATYGQDRLVELIRSYARGVTDDEAFTAATGSDLAAFDTAWQRSLGIDEPPAYGPQPAPPGPVPADWSVAGPAASLPAGATPGAPASAGQPSPGSGTSVSGAPAGTPGATPGGDAAGGVAAVLAVGAAAAVLALLAIALVWRRDARRRGPRVAVAQVPRPGWPTGPPVLGGPPEPSRPVAPPPAGLAPGPSPSGTPPTAGTPPNAPPSPSPAPSPPPGWPPAPPPGAPPRS